MTGLALKLIVFLAVAAAIFFGLRRIWRDWRAQFRAEDRAARQRDLRERARPDVIQLKRSEDGVFRRDEEKP